MKKIYFLAALLSGVVTFAQNASFETVSIGSSESYWNGADLSGTENPSGIFTSSYSESVFDFKTVYDTSWGAAYGLWSSGWAYSNQTSDTLTNLNGQHSSYAGGAFSGSQYAMGQQNSTITLNDNTADFSTIYITNSNYAAHSMLNGDMFAKQFGGTTGDDPDWFLLTIVGYDDQNQKIDSIELYLADYRFTDNSQDYVLKDWTQVDLSSIATSSYIEFNLSSSDVGAWGMNTPAFFAIDEITPSTSISVAEVSTDIALYPNPVNDQIFISGGNEISAYQVLSLDGKVLSTRQFQSGSIDVSSLSSGTYLIRLLGKTEVTTKSFIKY